MNIILEGPDNTGKTTLGEIIAEELGWTFKESEGREKYKGEMEERIKRWLKLDRCVMDRHPVVSQSLYFTVDPSGRTAVPVALKDRFYRQDNLIVYCRPEKMRGLAGHQVNDKDDAEFLRKLSINYGPLVSHYDQWAVRNAHIIWRRGEHIPNLINTIRGAIR